MNTWNNLDELITTANIPGDEQLNKKVIALIMDMLNRAGFVSELKGNSPTYQPVITAYNNTGNKNCKLVIYNHYDIEPVDDIGTWNTDPFKLTEKEGRLYARGIADNKGVLWARLTALIEMRLAGEAVPEICWLIQGEEETDGQTPWAVFPDSIRNFGGHLYLEETGMMRDVQPLLFYLPDLPVKPAFLEQLHTTVFNGHAQTEYRSLRKFTRCPFLNTIPDGGHYLGFGPNDAQSNVHRANESLDKQQLLNYVETFKTFLRWAAVRAF